MYGRMYTAEFENQPVTNANGTVDWYELAPAANKPIAIWELNIYSVGDEVGDADEEELRGQIIRGHATSGSGGATAVPAQPVNPNDAADACAIETVNTTIASAGSGVDLFPFGFNNRVGYEHIWTPGSEIQCSAAQTMIVVRLMGAVSQTHNFSGMLRFEEF